MTSVSQAQHPMGPSDLGMLLPQVDYDHKRDKERGVLTCCCSAAGIRQEGEAGQLECSIRVDCAGDLHLQGACSAVDD
jgi:hypothetical protein